MPERVCDSCGRSYGPEHYSGKQWKGKAGTRKCKYCVDPAGTWIEQELHQMEHEQHVVEKNKDSEQEQHQQYVWCLQVHDEGMALLQERQMDAALRKFTRARAASLKLHDRERALRIEHRVMSAMSTTYRLKKDVEGAIRLGTEAIALATTLGHFHDRAQEQRMLDIARSGLCTSWIRRTVELLDQARTQRAPEVSPDGTTTRLYKHSIQERNELMVESLVLLGEASDEIAQIVDEMM